ncbi:hypothetical protein A3D03_02855 [Candidatus Gottesmanbacteria bacterium RIFCSPHIGHO2_02_FULL_40_13]|uniref:Rod shape-determining protein MreD n=1 Tax=Candidatus Gottesmanbacteria bacterium RIFCSPHIGHO2_02_FULL_40_13 TaxID=1798384 RepID=A0A1F6AAE3_9BACT|nr:MAG: hypothetical protein A3D03_02855 [Candidatus Gottesmanbacteria bacterium RIFCSPHIGHO2_02_FULL_40_13]
MKYFLFIFIFLSLLIESALYPLPLSLIFAFMVSLHLNQKEASVIVFTEGLLLDLFSFRVFGTDSLIFLLLLVFLSLFRQKMHAGRALYRLILLFAACLIYSLFFYKIFSTGYIITAILSILGIFIYMERFFPVSLTDKRLSL